MRSSILPVSILPALGFVSLMGWAATKIAQSLSRRQPIRILHAIVLFLGLIPVDAVVSLMLIIDAALSHSEAAKASVVKLCSLSFLFLVVFPGDLLSFLAYRSHERSPVSNQEEP